MFILIWYVLYPNMWFFLFIPEIFNGVILLYPLLLFYLMGILDTIFRPITGQEKMDKYSAILLLFFFAGPIILILAYLEYDILISQLTEIIFPLVVLGSIIIIIGGIITLISRIQLERFASGVLMIQEDHKLITTGIYKYIRHPIYTGGLLQALGLYLAFHSIIITILALIIFFWLYHSRAQYEEQILEEEFGDEFRNYKKNSKKMIPFIY
ncbi:MAG: methyltransferase family protein [Candidatus Hodarchaeales archaeon]